MKKNNFGAVIVLSAATSLAAGAAFADVKTDQAIAKAEEQFTKGKPDEAIKGLAKAAQGAPSVEAYLALARLQEMNGNGDEANASLAKAVEVSASATPALKAQALAASAHRTLKTGSGKTAVDLANKAVAADKNAHSLGTLASAQARVGDVKAAHAAADAAIAAGATNSVAHAGKGDALTASGQHADAVASYRKAVELDPKNVSAQVGLAYALIATNKATEAKAVALKATEMDKNSGAAFAALGYSISAEKNFNGADASWTEAISQAQQGAFLSAGDVRVHVVLAKLFEVRGNYDQASAEYTKILEIDPNHAEAKVAIIKSQIGKGDLDGGLKAAKELVTASPESPEANKLYGELLARKGQYKEAVPSLEKATAAMPKSGDAWGMLAYSYQMTNSFEDARNAYAKAVELTPASNDLKSNYGLILGMSGDPAKGAEVLGALTTSPGYKSPAGFANYGWVLSRTKPPRAPEAIAAYKKAIELDPTNAGFYYGMGWAQYYAPNYPEAIAAFEKAGQMDKNLFAATRSGVGWAQYFTAVNENKNNPVFAKTKEALAAADAAGRPDPKLADAVARYEKAVADGTAAAAAAQAAALARANVDEAVDLGKLTRQLASGSNQQRVDAAKALGSAGADAAESLGYALENDRLFVVRQAALSSLRGMGSAARKAVPYITRYVTNVPAPIMQPTADEAKMEIMESDNRKAAAALLQRLR